MGAHKSSQCLSYSYSYKCKPLQADLNLYQLIDINSSSLLYIHEYLFLFYIFTFSFVYNYLAKHLKTDSRGIKMLYKITFSNQSIHIVDVFFFLYTTTWTVLCIEYRRFSTKSYQYIKNHQKINDDAMQYIFQILLHSCPKLEIKTDWIFFRFENKNHVKWELNFNLHCSMNTKKRIKYRKVILIDNVMSFEWSPEQYLTWDVRCSFDKQTKNKKKKQKCWHVYYFALW